MSQAQRLESKAEECLAHLLHLPPALSLLPWALQQPLPVPPCPMEAMAPTCSEGSCSGKKDHVPHTAWCCSWASPSAPACCSPVESTQGPPGGWHRGSAGTGNNPLVDSGAELPCLGYTHAFWAHSLGQRNLQLDSQGCLHLPSLFCRAFAPFSTQNWKQWVTKLQRVLMKMFSCLFRAPHSTAKNECSILGGARVLTTVVVLKVLSSKGNWWRLYAFVGWWLAEEAVLSYIISFAETQQPVSAM